MTCTLLLLFPLLKLRRRNEALISAVPARAGAAPLRRSHWSVVAIDVDGNDKEAWVDKGPETNDRIDHSST